MQFFSKIFVHLQPFIRKIRRATDTLSFLILHLLGTSLSADVYDTDWLGTWYTAYEDTPGVGWAWNVDHGWAYRNKLSSNDMWFWSPNIDWCWSFIDYYPLFYSPGYGWLSYLDSSSPPHRIFYRFEIGEWTSEQDMDPPLLNEMEVTTTLDSILLFTPWEEHQGLLLELRRTVNPMKCTDIWEIYKAQIVSRTGKGIYGSEIDLTSPGSRWEHAVRVKGDFDFSGGSIHNWEELRNYLVFIDDHLWNNTQLTENFTELTLIQESNLYRLNKPNQLLAIITTTTIIKPGEISIIHEIDWMSDFEASHIYIAMFPILRNKNGIQITRYETRDDNTRDISSNNFTEFPTKPSTTILWGGDIDIHFIWSSLIGSPNIVWISNSILYNKLYPLRSGSIERGTAWESAHIYQIRPHRSSTEGDFSPELPTIINVSP